MPKRKPPQVEMLEEIARGAFVAGANCAIGVAANVTDRIGPTLANHRELAELISRLPVDEMYELARRDPDGTGGVRAATDALVASVREPRS